MPLDELFAGFKMLNEGMNQYAIGEGIRDAQSKVDNLRTAQMSEMERRQQLTNISQDLTMRLGQVQAPVSQVQSVAGAIAPPPVGTSEQMYQQAVAKQDPTLMDMAKKMQEFEMAPKVGVIEKQGATDLNKQTQENVFKGKEGSAERANKLKIAEMLNDTKFDIADLKGKGGKPLNTKEVDTISALDESNSRAQSLIDKLKENPDLVGYTSSWNVLRFRNKDKADFDVDLGDLFQQYRKQMAGTRANEVEMRLLKKNRPTIDDSPEIAMSKLQTVMDMTTKVRNRYLRNLSTLGKKDVSQYVDQSAAPDHSAAAQWAKQNPNDPRAAAILKAQGK